jgi:hypothetical protein
MPGIKLNLEKEMELEKQYYEKKLIKFIAKSNAH